MLRATNRLSLMLAVLSFASCAPQPAADDTAAAQSSRGSAASSPMDEPIKSDAPAAPVQEASMCDATKAQFAVGQAYSDALAEQARTAAGAKIVRRLVPGQIITMEFSGERLNLDTDSAGKVIDVRCG